MATQNCILNPQTGRLRWTPKCSGTLAAIGSISGLLTGMLGVGGGFLLVLAFQQLSDIRIHSIVATSLMAIALISAMAVTGAVHSGAYITATGYLFIAARVSGMLLGRILCVRIPAKAIQLGFSAACIGGSLLPHAQNLDVENRGLGYISGFTKKIFKEKTQPSRILLLLKSAPPSRMFRTRSTSCTTLSSLSSVPRKELR